MINCQCQLTSTTPALTQEGVRQTHAVLRSVCRQPTSFLHTVDSPCSHPRATASEDNAALGQLTDKPTGARPDYRGRWCVASRGHPGRPKPPSLPPGDARPIVRAPKELPSTVGYGIAWTRTGDFQAIEHILHSTRSAFTGFATREPLLSKSGVNCIDYFD
ncbi:UNVERIFIED_CONTAM: hypothetical protein FKN15_028749 [Acipenser sinensis]